MHTHGHVSYHNNHTQTISNHPRAIKPPNSALSRPTPRSGRRVSLRRDVLAQAVPLRLGEGSKEEQGANTGSRLGESLLAWARCSLAQKLSRSPGRLFAQKGVWASPCLSRLGETGSLGRD